MTRRTRITLLVLLALALAEGGFFVLAVMRLERELPRGESAIGPAFPRDEELERLLPASREGAVTQEFADLDGDGATELVIGFAVPVSAPLTAPRRAPRLRALRATNDGWQFLDEFDFSADGVTGDPDTARLRGTPSFERKDVNGDGREELFVRLDIGSEFFHAIGVVVWLRNELAWAPTYDASGRLIPPLFERGGSTHEASHFIVEDAGNGGGLDFIAAHGSIDFSTGIERWMYDVYVEDSGVYRYDAAFSSALTAAGRRPGE